MQGIGIDVVDVGRLAASVSRDPGFAALVFSEGERTFCAGRRFPERHLACRFAAKEGFVKALGRGVLDGVPLAEIEVVEGPGTAPALRLGPIAARELARAGAREARLSLSRGARVCAAVVVLA
jgi:holo-[acyl-carrier protein] synthase